MTDIQLAAPTQSGPPGIKFPKVGQSVTVGIVDVVDYQQRNMKGELKTFPDGNPMTGKRVFGLVVENDGGIVTVNDEDRPVEEGDLVSFFCEGGRFFTWRDALKEHGAVNVGDIMTWKFDSEEPPKQKGYNKRKVFIAEIRPATMNDGEIKQLCIDEYMKLHQPKSQNLDSSSGEEETAYGM